MRGAPGQAQGWGWGWVTVRVRVRVKVRVGVRVRDDEGSTSVPRLESRLGGVGIGSMARSRSSSALVRSWGDIGGSSACR